MGRLTALSTAVKNMPSGAIGRLRGLANNFPNFRGIRRVGDDTVQTATQNVRSSPEAFADSVDTGVNIAKGLDDAVPPPSVGKNAPPMTKPPEENLPPLQKIQARLSAINTKLGSTGRTVTGTTLLAGVAVGTYMTVAGVFTQNTDGVEVKITKIEKIKDTTNRYKFTYSLQNGQKCGPSGAQVPCIKSAFKPCKKDTFTFRSTHTTPTLNDVTALVVDVGDDDSVELEIELTNVGDGTPEWGFMTCHTSFLNQFQGAVRDTAALAVGLAVDAVDAAGDGVCDAIKIPIFCEGGLDVGNWVVWLCIFLSCICCILGIAVVLM